MAAAQTTPQRKGPHFGKLWCLFSLLSFLEEHAKVEKRLYNYNSETREMKTTLIICPSSPSSLLLTCFVFKFKSFTITLLSCLKILVISPTLPPFSSRYDLHRISCILCKIGRLFGLHSFRSHRLSCQRRNRKYITQNIKASYIIYLSITMSRYCFAI